jgi:hypothetical protein
VDRDTPFTQRERREYERRLLTASYEDLICPVLISQLWCIAFSGFLHGGRLVCVGSSPRRGAGNAEVEQTYKLDGDLLVVEQVCAFEQNAKGALSNLLADAIVHAYDV